MSGFVDDVTRAAATRERDTEHVRRRSRPIIERVIAEHPKDDIDRWLAFSGACPWFSQWERNVWIDEIHRREEAA